MYVIYTSKQEAIDRELQLTTAGIKAGFFPEGERYDIGGLLIMHPTQDKAAIDIYIYCGMVTPLSQDDLLPCNYEPLFTEAELARKVDKLTPDWSFVQ
jgi:hypothetical protein